MLNGVLIFAFVYLLRVNLSRQTFGLLVVLERHMHATAGPVFKQTHVEIWLASSQHIFDQFEDFQVEFRNESVAHSVLAQNDIVAGGCDEVMSAKVRKISEEVAEVRHWLLIDGLEHKRTVVIASLDLLDDASRNLRRKIFLSLNNADHHRLRDVQGLKTVLIWWASHFETEQRKSAVEILRNVATYRLSNCELSSRMDVVVVLLIKYEVVDNHKLLARLDPRMELFNRHTRRILGHFEVELAYRVFEPVLEFENEDDDAEERQRENKQPGVLRLLDLSLNVVGHS